MSHDMRLLNVQCVKEPDGVIGHRLNRQVLGSPSTLANATIVERQAVKVSLQRVRLRLPGTSTATNALNEQHGFTSALAVVVQRDFVKFKLSHKG